MKPRPAAAKAKPFRLVKYFSFSSLILIFCGTIVLSVLNTHWIRSVQFTKSEDYALLLIENLNHEVFVQFILPVGLKYGKIELRQQDQFERLDGVVRGTLRSFNVDLVNIYGLKDLVAYSYSQDLIGIENHGGADFQKALVGGSSSKLVQKGSFWELLLGAPKEIKIITFAPLRAVNPLSPISGPVLGVVELVQDLSEDYESVFRYQVMILVTASGVMLILFLIMTIVVKRGEGIIRNRAQERLELKEQLSRAQNLSTLGEMVAAVSHEIRNPLGIISSSAELMQKRVALDEDASRILHIIMEESRRLNNIITDFLNFAKPREPNLFACQIEEVVARNIESLASHLDDKGCLIRTRYDHDLPEIHADADMLYQAVLNILINAMQAMPDGGNIDIAGRSDAGNLRITFEDQGGGVAKEVLDKIWDPFFTTRDKGTGLGLGIVKKIIEAHDGRIWIENRNRGGTRVVIELPVRDPGAA